MTPSSPRTTVCSATERAGRLTQAEGFWRDAEDLRELGTGSTNTLVTLYVHAGIASADVVCCAKLGEYSSSVNHSDALALIRRADAKLASPLQRLLSVKSAAGYGASPASSQRVVDSRNAAEKLLSAARML